MTTLAPAEQTPKKVRQGMHYVPLEPRARCSALQAPGDAGRHCGGQARREIARDPLHLPRAQAGETATTDELVARCRKDLLGYKCPRYVGFAELPKAPTGEIQKFKVREIAKEV